MNVLLPGKTILKRELLQRGGQASKRMGGLPFVIAGMFRTANGLGEVARRFYNACQIGGLSPIPIDTSEILNQVDFDPSLQIGHMPQSRSGTLLLIANPPEIESLLTRLRLWRWKSWRVISYWCWELEQIPQSWPIAERYTSEIWTLSDFARDAIAPHLSGSIRTVPIPVPAPKIVPNPSSNGPLRCLMMADGRSSFARKNIFAGVRMFKTAFSDPNDANLTLKLRHVSAYPDFQAQLFSTIEGHPNISVVEQTVSDEARWNLINEHDLVLSPHRAEGYGLHLAEAMVLEKCVIATGWSGNLQFMNQENSVLLPFEIEPVEDAFGVYDHVADAHWAKIDEAAGIAALRDLKQYPEKRSRIGRTARRDILNKLSNEAIFAQIKHDLPIG